MKKEVVLFVEESKVGRVMVDGYSKWVALEETMWRKK